MSTDSSNEYANYSVFAKRCVVFSVMLVTIIEVLDMTIVTVSLPAMMGALNANTDQITWVITSYVVAAGICMPLTGFLVKQIGTKKLLLINIVGFLIASALCGMASSLMLMVMFRVLQGVFGASLVPLSQYILSATYSKQEIGKAMAIWGMGIMTAPVLGPTLGGYITEYLNWRWIFYANVPFCLLAAITVQQVVRETATTKITIDWLGMLLMAVGIGSLQLFLDRGNPEGWFQSNTIVLLAAVSCCSLTLFIYRGLRLQHTNIINLYLFANRNFALATVILASFCGIFLSGIMLQPMLIESLLHYPSDLTGLVVAPRGLSSAIGMMLTANLMKRFDNRHIAASGVMLTAIGSWLMTKYNLDISMRFLIVPAIIQGFGMGLFFVPLSTISLLTLPKESAAEASGLYSFGRSIGISIGLSLLTTILTHMTTTNWYQLSEHINPFNMNLQQRGFDGSAQASQQLAGELYRQAAMIAYNDLFMVVFAALLLLIPMIYLMQPVDSYQPEQSLQTDPGIDSSE